MKILTVPVRVDAFVAKETESVVSTTDAFDNLPYVNKQKFDVHFDVANIASSIGRKPLNSYNQLPKGVHLHWSMPDALTEGEAGDDDITMPVVPNRWLVRRERKSDGQVKAWVVESDYLYPDGVVPERAITIPAMTDKAEGAPNCQYLGRQLPLAQWQAEPAIMKQSHRYLPELNVLGWGTPYFSSLYTDCYSVFGFYDDELSDEQVSDYEYQVYGWYGDPTQDFVQQKLQAAGVAGVEQAKEVADWVIELADGEKLDGMVCYGKVRFDASVTLNDDVDAAATTITFAKTPSEAMATWLSKTQVGAEAGDAASAVKLENQLLALLYNADMEGQDIDFVDRLKSARHKAEFHAVSGGQLWALLDDASIAEDILDAENKALVQTQWAAFKSTIRVALTDINKLQESRNQADDRVDYQRRMLYNDWSKYMLSLHPVDLEGDYYPDIDMLRLLMTQQTIPALEQALARLESLDNLLSLKISALRTQFSEWKSQFSVNVDPATLVDQDDDEPADLIPLTDKLPADLLEEIPAPRYWQPKDPCILIAGDVAKPSLRHGEDGELACRIVDAASNTSVWGWLSATAGSDEWQWHEHGVNHWGKQPWSPLMVEWSMNLYPDESASQGIEANQFKYSRDFITSHYRIPLNDEQFGLPSASIDLRRDRGDSLKTVSQPTVVNGRSLVTDSVRQTLDSRIKRYLASSDNQDTVSETTQAMMDRVQTVSDRLDSSDCTILSLDGLYDDLLMYSNLSLMDVDDPFKFAPRQGDMHITDKVRGLLQGHDFKLPAIGHRFTPIKSGIQKLGVLQLVDTFGRYKEINTEQLLRPHRQLIGNAVYSPPRVLQPSRLSFRWVDNLASGQPTPIQGWLGYNLFDETILMFNEAGEFLGHLNSDGEWCDENGLMQSLADDMPKQLREFALKLMSFHANNRIKKSIFLTQPGATEALWQSFIDLGVLRPMSDDKALLVAMSEADWTAHITPVTGISFAASRSWFIYARASQNYWPRLKQAVRRGIDNIEPETAVEKGQPGTIKPLAIVKAQLDIQLQGGGESDKSWSALKLDLNKHRRSDRDYLKVEFPIKLGEFNNLDDGLIAYWKVSEGQRLPGDGYFPQSDMDDVEGYIDAANFDPNDHDYVDQIREEGVANLTQSLEANPISILMLMDPDASVHATTGIVPKKALYLPPESYRDVVGNIRSRYFIAPLLTPAQQTTMPLPAGEEWLWEMPSGDKDADGQPIHVQQMNVDMLDKSAFIAAGASDADWQWLLTNQLIAEIDGQPDMAWLQAPDESLTAEAEQRLMSLVSVIDEVALPGILSVNDVTPLDGKIRVMEGWLSTQDSQAIDTY